MTRIDQTPVISIDRASKSFAVFIGLDCIKPFTDYQNETLAVIEAMGWLHARGHNAAPEIVYPRITAMRIFSRRRK